MNGPSLRASRTVSCSARSTKPGAFGATGCLPRCSGMSSGGELDQIQFLLGHVSIQTTERYLGCKQKLRCAVNDRLGIEPGSAA
jgi:hypothetical protein